LSGVNVVLKSLALGLWIFLFFVFMSGLDFVVHRVLYSYGLLFSFDWAVVYWGVYGCVFFVFGVVIGFVYWLGSGRSRRDIKISLCLFLSIVLLSCGGLADVLWFVFWGGGLPAADVVWWWMPWYTILGFWNSVLQLGLLCGVFLTIATFWILILRKDLF